MPSSTSIPSGRSREVAGAPDVIWLNGAFGVGKTTVAELLVERIEGGTLIDPEVIGSMLRVLLPADWQTDDWQDLPLWRDLTREAILGLSREGKGPLIVPMTVVQPDYFDAIVGELRRSDLAVRHFTLVASVDTVMARLAARADDNGWARDRASRCVALLVDREFAEHVLADGRQPAEIADEIAARLSTDATAPLRANGSA